MENLRYHSEEINGDENFQDNFLIRNNLCK